MSIRLAAAVLAAASLAHLAGCRSGESGPPSSPSDPAALVGRTWTLSTMDGKPLVANTTITAEFTADGRVAGRSGCNSYGGSAKAASGRLTVGDLASTLMACQGDGVMEQESRYLAAIRAATAYAVANGELRLGPSATAASLVFGSRD